MRGTSGSVQRRPANPARPGREQRYRDHAVCRGVPKFLSSFFYFYVLANFMAETKIDTKTNYQVIARKWRPQTFEDVVGQSHVMTTLENAIRTNRIAHAYIFSGARGVGKTTTARILAKAL